jgi:uncharacterized protein with PIN domain
MTAHSAESDRPFEAPRDRPLTVFDAQAIMALLLDEPAAGAVEAELRDSARRSTISAVNLAEIVDVMARVFGQPPDGRRDGGTDLEDRRWVGHLVVAPRGHRPGP